MKCANHEAVIGGNYDNSIPRARAIVRVHSAHVCERSVRIHMRIYGMSNNYLLLLFINSSLNESDIDFTLIKGKVKGLILYNDI